MMIGDLSDCQLQSHSRGTHLPALQARHRGQYPPPPEGSERGSAPCRHTDLSADLRHLRPLAATRSAIWQPKQVKQNSEGGKAWWEANPGGKVVKSEQFGGFVSAITFTGFSSERYGPLKFWTVDSHNTQTGICYSLGSFTTLEEAVAFLESIKGPSSE